MEKINVLRAMYSAFKTFDLMRKVHRLSVEGHTIKEGKLQETFRAMVAYMDDTAPHFHAIGLKPPRMQYDLAA